MRLFFSVLASTILVTACSSTRMVQTPVPESMQVVMLGIGAKNPTFDEARFPHLQVVYTPKLVSQAKVGENTRAALTAMAGDETREIFKGKPTLLETWWDEMDLRNHAVLVDTKGTGAWQGWIDRRDAILESASAGDRTALGTTLAEILEDGKVIQASGKAFDPEDSDGAIGASFPDWPVSTADGQQTTMHALMSGKPTLVVVFQIQSIGDLQAAKKSQKDESFGSFMGNMMRGAAADSVTQTFERLEGQLYQYDTRE
jgi:hypothetical protein